MESNFIYRNKYVEQSHWQGQALQYPFLYRMDKRTSGKRTGFARSIKK
ncbi:MAG: hypothetical protein WC159_08300 [Sphaerochaetaceae bacterium]